MAEDRNQTVKKQLLKKREETAKKKIPLAPGEMVDDALARGLAGSGKWLKKNFGTLQWVFVAAVAAGIGYAIYDHQMEKRAQQASAALMKGTASEAGRISGSNAPPKPPGEEGVEDPTPVFKTADERRDTALASYRKVVSNYPGTGAAILARMGEAGIALDHRDWDIAVSAYNEVKDSALAKADPTVRGRALEGIGLALEGKGDADGALKSFRDLENNSITGLKELGMYHQARILFAKGDTDKPKELLKSAREKLKNATSGSSAGPSGEMHPFAFLESQIDDLLRRIDPSAVPSTPMPGMSPGMPGMPGMKGMGGDPRQLTPEKMRQLQEQLRKQLEDANKEPPCPSAGRIEVKRVVTAGAWLAILAGVTGCEALQSGASPELPLWVRHPSGAMNVILRAKVTVSERVSGEDYEHGRPEIDSLHRRVFVGSSDGGLYALRSDDGSSIWRFQTTGPVQSEPLYERGEDVVYFGSNDGALYKVKAADGSLVWRFNTNAEVSRKPVIQNGVLYVVNANDTIVAMDARTGKTRWTQHRTPAFGMEIAGYAGPLVTRDRVYVAFSDGHVAAYDPLEGTERWPVVDLSAEVEQAQGDVPRYLDVDTTPVLDTISAGRVVYVASYAGGVFALDAQTGARIWVNDRATGVTQLVLWQDPAHRPRDGVGPAIPARKLLLASAGTTGLWALGTEEGREVWRRPLPNGGVSAPVPIAGALMVSTTRYGLFLFSPLDGGVIDGLDLTNGLTMAPAVVGRRAYVMSNTGVLLGVHVDPPGGI